MSGQLPREVLEETYRRLAGRSDAVAEAERSVGAVLASAFDKQDRFISSKRRRKAAFCTRRAGKTEGNARYLVSSAMGGADRLCIFVAITAQRAEDLVWKPIEKMNEALGLGASANRTKRTWAFPNGSTIRLTGADDIEALRKKRGDKCWLVIIDEAQDFPFSILKGLVEDVFDASLEDLGGTMCLTGTPGMVCAGYWYQVTRHDGEPRTKGWEVHEWSVLDNPHMAHMKVRLPELKEERGWADDHPTYVREWLGRWVNDFSALFYRFDLSRNLTRDIVPHGPGWEHVIGWDLGKTDAQALVCWGFHPKVRKVVEVFSWKQSNTTSDEVVAEVRRREEALKLNVIARVADTGGLGALVVEEVGRRTGMWFEAAKKTEKLAHVELFNEDLRAGNVQLAPGSVYAEEMAVLPKDPDWVPEEHDGKPAPEDPRFPNHCCDAGLYAWRRALHWLHEPEPEKPAAGTPAAYQAEAEEMEREREEELERRASLEWWEQ